MAYDRTPLQGVSGVGIVFFLSFFKGITKGTFLSLFLLYYFKYMLGDIIQVPSQGIFYCYPVGGKFPHRGSGG